MNRLTKTPAVGCAAALIGGSAHAVVIYSDDFSGSGGTDLHGTTPDVSTTGESWVARNTYKADGSFSWEANAAMTLAFTPVDGRVYTLDAKIENITGAHWTQFGFGNGQPSIATDPIWSTRAWHLLRVAEDGSNSHHTYLNGFGSGAAWSTLNLLRYDQPLDARIVLDTTGGTGNWTATWLAKADSDAAYTEVRAATVLTAQDIDSVGFSVYNTTKTGKLLSFSLSDDAGGSIPGDFDGDGDVDGVDISTMFSNFTGPGGTSTNPQTDLDGDGDTDGVDISSIFGLFTGPLAPATVPEPTSFALVGMGGLLIARRRRG